MSQPPQGDESITRCWWVNHHQADKSSIITRWWLMSQSPEADELIITSWLLATLEHGGAVCIQVPTSEWAVCPSAIVPVDYQMVGQLTYRTTRWVGFMSVWYPSWPPDGGAAHLEDHQVSGLYVSLVPQLTTRWWGSPPRGPPGEWAVCQSDTIWPPDGGAAHLQDHQVSGQYVSLVPVDHQMVGQPT
jgi:hypothetical protein